MILGGRRGTEPCPDGDVNHHATPHCFCRAHVICVTSSRTSSLLFRGYSALIYCTAAEAFALGDVLTASGKHTG